MKRCIQIYKCPYDITHRLNTIVHVLSSSTTTSGNFQTSMPISIETDHTILTIGIIFTMSFTHSIRFMFGLATLSVIVLLILEFLRWHVAVTPTRCGRAATSWYFWSSH